VSVVVELTDISSSMYGRIVGQGGKTIKMLQQQYKVTINVPGRNEPGGVVCIEGSSTAIVERACAAVRQIVSGSHSSEEKRHASVIVELTDISPSVYGIILGKGGETIKELQQQYKVKINVPGRNKPKGVVRIEGSSKAIKKKACAAVRQIGASSSDASSSDTSSRASDSSEEQGRASRKKKLKQATAQGMNKRKWT
jgi:polyribonucleotide nucleotidyltransferase